ncbi:MAG: ABC transporter substrate-binding protein [Deltaproteobacteria bacterium]|nr:ABC transporter substrate-binding protein [Deltaproteobacteria bacterium]
MKPYILIFLLYIFSHQICFCIEIGTVEEAPGNFTDENGVIVGLSVDFVKEIQRRVGNNSPIEMLPGARFIHYSLEKPNYVVFSLSRSEAREDKYHWITLVMRKPLCMIARKDSNIIIKNLEDAKNYDGIGVLLNSVQHDFLIEKGFTNIETVRAQGLNLKKLYIGRMSLMYHSMHGAAKLCRDMNLDINEIEPVLILQVSNSSIAMSKDSDPAIVRAWQDAAKEIKADGTFDRLAQKWLEYTEEYIGIPSEIKDGALNLWRE